MNKRDPLAPEGAVTPKHTANSGDALTSAGWGRDSQYRRRRRSPPVVPKGATTRYPIRAARNAWRAGENIISRFTVRFSLFSSRNSSRFGAPGRRGDTELSVRRADVVAFAYATPVRRTEVRRKTHNAWSPSTIPAQRGWATRCDRNRTRKYVDECRQGTSRNAVPQFLLNDSRTTREVGKFATGVSQRDAPELTWRMVATVQRGPSSMEFCDPRARRGRCHVRRLAINTGTRYWIPIFRSPRSGDSAVYSARAETGVSRV